MMISFVKGKLVHATPTYAIVETGGIGYKIYIPASVYPSLPKNGSEVLLYTSLVIREISQTLYGFLSEDERGFFEEITTVSGIGPKLALSLIGHLPMDEMHLAIGNNDIPAISRVPGIGKKTAQRLIIEMRDRVAKSNKHCLPSDFAIEVQSDPRAQNITDAMNALINLGYNQVTAQKAIKKSLVNFPEPMELSTLITDALKNV
ncbi:MAG: Holliday junction branch migration protein RuvA [Waddliaceae bacterium]